MCELYYCQIYLYLNAINSFNEKEKKNCGSQWLRTVFKYDCVFTREIYRYTEKNVIAFLSYITQKNAVRYHSFIKPSDTQLNEDNKLKQTTPAHVIYSTLKGVVDCTKFKPLRFALQAEFNKIKLCLNI